MRKIKLEFTERQAWEIFHMMEEGSVGYIETHWASKDYASARVCKNAIESFYQQLLEMNPRKKTINTELSK